MSDHFKFDIPVEIYDWWDLEFGRKEFGDKIRNECIDAVEKVLESNGFCAGMYFVGGKPR